MLANHPKTKLINNSLRKKWSELKKMVEKKSVDKVSAHKYLENLIKNLNLSLKSSKKVHKLKCKLENFYNNLFYSKTFLNRI